MENKMKVNIDHLMKLTFHILTKLKESKGDEIELHSDYYWDFADEEIYNPYEDPQSIT